MAERHVYLSDDFSVPESSLCMHAPESPNADFRCLRAKGHPGKHEHHLDFRVRDCSWKDRATKGNAE